MKMPFAFSSEFAIANTPAKSAAGGIWLLERNEDFSPPDVFESGGNTHGWVRESHSREVSLGIPFTARIL
jgi:hypothetical protein